MYDQYACSMSLCHTLRNHPFTFSTVYKNLAGWTKDVLLLHNTLFQSSVVRCRCFTAQLSLFVLFCHFSHGFFTATRLVKPADRSLPFTAETEICLLPPLLSWAWSCCPVSHLSRKLLTQKVLILSWLGLSQTSLPVKVSKSLWMSLLTALTVLTDTCIYLYLFSHNYGSNILLPAVQYCQNNASEGVVIQPVLTLLSYKQTVCR